MAAESATLESLGSTPPSTKSMAKKAKSNRRAPKKRSGKKPAATKKAGTKSAIKKTVASKKSVGKKTAAKKRKFEKAPSSKATTKAQAIRDAAKDIGGKPRPKDIIAALGPKGIAVSSPQVISVLKAAGLYRRRQKAWRGVVAKVISSNGRHHAVNFDDLLLVKDLAAKLGGTDNLKAAVLAFERLQ